MSQSTDSDASKLCKLCGKFPPIDNSHILSKFMWKNSGLAHRSDYKADNKGYDLTFPRAPEWNERGKKKGITESILCSHCEKRRNPLETYMAGQLYDSAQVITKAVTGHRVVEGLDYAKVKLFNMFNLFMMGVAENPFYSAVDLGAKHEEKLRQMLLADEHGDPGEPWEYFALCFRLQMNGKPFEGIASPPQRSQWPNGQTMYRFAFAGLCWMVTCSSHPHEKMREPLFIGVDGRMVVFDGNPVDMPFIREQLNNWLVTQGHPPLKGR